MGTTRKHVDDTQTLIVVGVNRLREEYETGRSDQMKDEHWRKQVRISLAGLSTSFGLVGSFFDVDSSPFIALFVNFIIHVVL